MTSNSSACVDHDGLSGVKSVFEPAGHQRLSETKCNFEESSSGANDNGNPTGFQPIQVKSQSLSHADEFLKAMRKHQITTNDLHFKALDLSVTYSWADVINSAKEAEETYLKDGTKVWRKIGRIMSQSADSAMPFLSLLSLNAGSVSVLYSALKCVFEVAAKVGNKNLVALKILASIPTVMLRAERALSHFPHDQDLKYRIEQLYVVVLTAVEGTIKWLEMKPMKKQINSCFRGSPYNTSFEDSIKALDQALADVQDQVSYLLDKSLLKTEKGVEEIEGSLKYIRATGETVNTTSSRTLYEVQMLMESQIKTQESVAILGQEELRQAKIDANRALNEVLEERTENTKWRKKIHRELGRLTDKFKRFQRENARFTPESLLYLLDVNSEVLEQDLEQIRRACDVTLLCDTPVSLSLLQGEAFDKWYDPDDWSTQLFIEGGLSPMECERNTALTLVCSKLVEVLQQKNKLPAVPIFFFCGAHATSQDSLAGPQGLMRSLICQLLRTFVVQTDFAFYFREQLKSYDIRALCDCLKEIVVQIPSTTILVIVLDGICFFETYEWQADCQRVIRLLTQLVQNDELGPALKLFVTSPFRSSYVADIFPSECRLPMPGSSSNERTALTGREIARISSRASGSQESTIIQSLRNRQPPGQTIGEWSDFSDSCSSDVEMDLKDE